MFPDPSKKHQYYFSELCKIPHGSHNEKAVSDWVKGFAEKRGLRYLQDDMYNIIVYKGGSKGYESSKPVILQGHMDMVQEATKGTSIDFSKDPLTLICDGDWLKASGTTLGADDGVGVAYMLAILDDDTIARPPLECVFTVSEEVGLIGANHLKPDYFKSKRMIGLDSSGENKTPVSTAGGERITSRFEMKKNGNESDTYSVSVSGLLGGHSGEQINTGRSNSIILTNRFIKEMMLSGIRVNIVSYTGGLKENAIPRECEIVFCSDSPFSEIEASFEKTKSEVTGEIEGFENGFCAKLSRTEKAPSCFDDESSRKIADLIFIMPNGVITKSAYDEKLVTTSLNLGSIRTDGDAFILVSSLRSSFDSAKADLENRVTTLVKLFGGTYVLYGKYCGWSYHPVSPMRDQLRESLKKLTGKDLVEESVHAGFECGVFSGLGVEDIIAFGPVMEDIHTPKERLSIRSFDTTFEILLDVLASLK